MSIAAKSLPVAGGVLDGKVTDIPRRCIDKIAGMLQLGEAARPSPHRLSSCIAPTSDTAHSGLYVGARHIFSIFWSASRSCEAIIAAVYAVVCNTLCPVPLQPAHSGLPARSIASGISGTCCVHELIQRRRAKLARLIWLPCRLVFVSRGGTPDEQKDRVLTKQFRESNEYDRSDYLLGYEVRPVVSFHSHSSVYRSVKSWAQSWVLFVRDKTGCIRLHRKKSNIACLADGRLTLQQVVTSYE